jgi:xanthine dehydrogenase accessory factor
MKELKEIVKAYDHTLKLGRKMALASVIHVEGSSYRRAGARMLVDDEGMMTGAISGGCLEGDALRKAQLVIAQQDPKLISYDTSDEEDMSIGVQLGCAGVIQVLFEPIAASQDPIALFRKLLSKRQKAVLVTVYNPDKTQDQFGTCLLLEEDGKITSHVPVSLEKLITEDAEKVLQEQSSSYKQYQYQDSKLTAFLEFIPPPTSLIVIGAGNDAIPLVNIGSQLGWDVRVVDGRSTHARADRFQGACQVLVSKPELILNQVKIDEHTAFVLMTHNYNYDLAMLKALLQTAVAYIGVLGPKKKLDRMLDEIIASGTEMTDEITNRIFGPVGLEIGAETSEEIALSIIAEVKAVLSGKSGSSLRDKPGSIHAIYHS